MELIIDPRRLIFTLKIGINSVTKCKRNMSRAQFLNWYNFREMNIEKQKDETK